jgi:dTDP-4-dehydrorhamnose 3,5-epimerase-like enzyme
VTLAQARTIELPTHKDPRGILTAIEAEADIPFPIQRLFFLYDIAPPFERGGHAHPDTELLVVCLHSSMRVDLMDGSASETYALTRASVGLYIPAMIWTRLYAFTPDTVMLAVASTHYDEPQVIRSWDDYVRRVQGA